MKTNTLIFIAAFILLAFGAGMWSMRYHTQPASPQSLTLEQVLSIRELHLVKHTYQDLFFIHKQNNPTKAIRAIVQVPVEVTAYLNLKDIQLIRQGDSLKRIVLPHAQLRIPTYHVNQMIVRETRGWQLHVGRDLYPTVSQYWQQVIAERTSRVETLAMSQRILVQAETEVKEYLVGLLRTVGRPDIVISFVGEEEQPASHPTTIKPKSTLKEASMGLGFVPW